MGTNPIGPTGPRGSDETLEPPVTSKAGTAAQKAKEKAAIGPTGPRSAPVSPKQPAEAIGPTEPPDALKKATQPVEDIGPTEPPDNGT
jgi:hypothetical protein